MSIDTESIVTNVERRRGTSVKAPQPDQEEPLVIGPLYIGTVAEQKARAEAQLRLLDEWTGEDPEDDRETLAWLAKALDEDRPAQRKLFPGGSYE